MPQQLLLSIRYSLLMRATTYTMYVGGESRDRIRN